MPNRRETITLLAGTAATSLAAVSAPTTIHTAQAQPQAQAAKPNILFMLVDNLGYGELGVYGGGITRGTPTSRLDKFASEGLRLTNMNMEAQCTPSRSAILTGRYAICSGTPFRAVRRRGRRADAMGSYHRRVAICRRLRFPPLASLSRLYCPPAKV
jgi:hypothetical protein